MDTPAATLASKTQVIAVPSSSMPPSFVRITALPPASSESSKTLARVRAARSKTSISNIVYFAPLFGVLGALTGAFCSWLVYRHLPSRRRSHSRESALVSGPQYTPPTRFRRSRPASGGALLQGDGEGMSETKSKGTWFGRAFASRSKASSVVTEQAARDDTTGSEEDDPFLHNSSPTDTPTQVSRRGTTTSMASGQVPSSQAYDPVSTHEDGTSLRQPSIRRSLLDRLRPGSMRWRTEDAIEEDDRTPERPVQYRRGHKRADSDAIVEGSTTLSSDMSSRRPSIHRNRSSMIVSPSGFRILIEDPESGALLEDDEMRTYTPEASPTPRAKRPTSAARQRQASDKFTPAPLRRSISDKRNSPFSSPSKARTATAFSPSLPSPQPIVYRTSEPIAGYRPGGLPRVDSSVLPMSPPMVTSPPLESQLFFGSTTSLDAQFSAAVHNKVLMPAPAARPGQHHNKLRTQRPPPPLPFPSTASTSPYRGRLKKTPTSKGGPSRSGSRSGTAGGGARGNAAERHIARKTALSKVEEIVSRSWSERQIAGGAYPGSPNNFGAGAATGSPIIAQMAPTRERKVDRRTGGAVTRTGRLADLRE
ncbi:hypothetical protein C8Q80DRAFT_1114105 [Daedaleopsis nitida]|nr:hypothetical protein C8Q80DRAFT_1114105 [Daedaleopsis nitida]